MSAAESSSCCWIAAVRHCYVGEDSVWRLHLMFLDEQAPSRLLSQ